MGNIWGQDIKLDENNQAMVTANGELALTVDVETGVQDVKIMLDTPLGSLFYDSDFGSMVHLWGKEENTLSNRMTFCAEVARRIHGDQRVKYGSATCTIVSWNEKGISAEASWEFIDIDHVYNLVITIGETMEMVIKDVNSSL